MGTAIPSQGSDVSKEISEGAPILPEGKAEITDSARCIARSSVTDTVILSFIQIRDKREESISGSVSQISSICAHISRIFSYAVKPPRSSLRAPALEHLEPALIRAKVSPCADIASSI